MKQFNIYILVNRKPTLQTKAIFLISFFCKNIFNTNSNHWPRKRRAGQLVYYNTKEQIQQMLELIIDIRLMKSDKLCTRIADWSNYSFNYYLILYCTFWQILMIFNVLYRKVLHVISQVILQYKYNYKQNSLNHI